MSWNDELRAAMPREDIPAFLADLQALVAALREELPLEERLTARLRVHPELVLGYLQAGPKRDAVKAAL